MLGLKLEEPAGPPVRFWRRNGLGSRLDQVQYATMVAMASVDKSFLASLSYLVATQRKSLSRQNTASTIHRNP